MKRREIWRFIILVLLSKSKLLNRFAPGIFQNHQIIRQLKNPHIFLTLQRATLKALNCICLFRFAHNYALYAR